jgi:hypothetical protein
MTRRRTRALGWAVVGLAVLVACAPPPPPSKPTVQAAATQAVGTVQSVATAVAPTASAAQTQVVGTVSGAQTQVVATVAAVAPTVSAAQTQVAPTAVAVSATVGAASTVESAARRATATVLAPTAQVVATQVAPTVQSAATQVTGAVATSVAESPIQIAGVNINGADSTVDLRNSHPVYLVLDGWNLLVGPAVYVSLYGVAIPAEQTTTLHFSAGVDTPRDTYLGPMTVPDAARLASVQPGSPVVLVAPGNRIASVYVVP